MKKLVLFFMLYNVQPLFCQEKFFFVYVQNNSSNVEIVYTEKPEEGTLASNKIYTPGIGIQHNLISGPINFDLRLGYTLKGFKFHDAIQEYGPQGTLVDLRFELVDKLHYFNFDVLLSYQFFKSKLSKPYISLGIQNGFLFAKDAQNFQSYYADVHAPFKDLKDYETFTISGLVGVGYLIKKYLFLEIIANKDLLGVIRRPEIKVKNVLFSFNLGINITEFAK